MDADIHVCSWQPLRKGRLIIVQISGEAGTFIHAEDDEALKTSPEQNHLKEVAVLIEQGADPEIARHYGTDKLSSFLDAKLIVLTGDAVALAPNNAWACNQITSGFTCQFFTYSVMEPQNKSDLMLLGGSKEGT